MANSLPLLKGSITLEEALESEVDILQELSYPEQRLDFFCHLYANRSLIEELVAFHLGVPRQRCRVASSIREWIHGSFNAVVPVYTDLIEGGVRKVFIRFPLPFKTGESFRPGNSDEKLRCEAATYVWISNNCAGVPIPRLRGFGLASGWTFTAPENAPLIAPLVWTIRRTALRLLGLHVPTRYVSRRRPCLFETPFIIDDVEQGSMLSETWDTFHKDLTRRSNLFKDLSQIMLSIARTPFTAIGSLTINDCGVISHSNRPLTLTLQQRENANIPTDIPRDQTYARADAYYSDLLNCQDSRFRHLPNSINNIEDGQHQLAAATLMRTALRQLTDQESRRGPFALMLTDLHQSKIFVDEDWNVKSIIDLEWTCALPREMLRAPMWLTGQSIDPLVDDELREYEAVHAEFLTAFSEIEQAVHGSDCTARLIRRSWETGATWFFAALNCLNWMSTLYVQHVQERRTTVT